VSKEDKNIENTFAAIEHIEKMVSEGFSSPYGFDQGQINVFGRPLIQSHSKELSFTAGLTATGLRSSAVLDSMHLENNITSLRMTGNQLLPLTVHVLNGQDKNPQRSIFDILQGDHKTFQLVPSNIQEVLDFALIAHKIAELSLVPGVIISEFNEDEAYSLSEYPKSQNIEFIGNSDDQIDLPTPAQKIIFGKSRRRIPNWFNLDLPVLMGSSKDAYEVSMSAAAYDEYIYSHLAEIIDQTFGEFNLSNGTKYQDAGCDNPDCKYLIISCGGVSYEIAGILPLTKDTKVAQVDLKILHPFPERRIFQILQGKRAVTILESASGNNTILNKVSQAVAGQKNGPNILSGLVTGPLTESDLEAIIENMMAISPKERFYLNLEFTRSKSQYPKHQVLLQQIQRDYPSLKDAGLISKTGKTETPVAPSTGLPLAIRQFKNQGPPYTHQTGFIDHTGLFYETGNIQEQVADPFKALQFLPSATASISSLDQTTSIPNFKPENCTACGSCFLYCPHSAIPTVALGNEQIIRAGMEKAGAEGTQVVALIPQVKNLAKIVGKRIKELGSVKDLKVEDLLVPAFEELIEKSDQDEKKSTQMEVEFKSILNSISGLPISITDVLYNDPEKQEKGSGSLFSLLIDTSACTGCGLCAIVCDDEALEIVESSPLLIEKQKSELKVWEILPDTSADVVNRLLHDPSFNSFSALLMSRNFNMSIVGGSVDEQGAPAKQITHLITAVTESILQPQYAALVNEIEDLETKLSENIHSFLSATLPKENFEAINDAISANTGKASLADIINRMGDEPQLKKVNTEDLRRKINLKDDLKSLSWVITEGPSGIGRSRYGIVIDKVEAFKWSEVYPYNSFTSPAAVLWDESAPEVSLGLIQGQMRHFIDNIKLLRRARLEIKDKYIPREHDAQIALLNWSHLDEKEKLMVPPILVIGDGKMLIQNRKQLLELLSSGLPLKVFIIDDLGYSPDQINQLSAAQAEMIALMALNKAYIFQGGLSTTEELFNRLVEGIQLPTPALYRLFAPMQTNHSIPENSWPGLCSLVINSRTLPVFSFNPTRYEGYLNSAVRLEANLSKNEVFHCETLSFDTDGSEENITFALTWADWAYTLHTWQDHFRPYQESDGASRHVTGFIDDPRSEGNYVPVIYRVNDGVLNKYIVSNTVVETTRVTVELWNILREIGGELTQFPEKLRKQVEADLHAEHQAEIEALKKDFEDKLQTSEKEQIKAIRERLQEKLAELAGRKIPQE